MKSILERVRGRFNVSIAETGYLDSWRDAEIGLAAVSNDPGHAGRVIEAALRLIEADGRSEIVAVERET